MHAALMGGHGGSSGASLPRLRRRGHCLEKATGERFTVIECSDFFLYGRYLNGEDITPILIQRAQCGFNTLRVWTLMKLEWAGIGDITLDEHPDFYTKLPSFLKLCESYGFYIELTAYIGPPADPNHWYMLGEAVRHSPNVLLELVNENDVHPIDLSPYSPISGVLCSHGSNGSQAWPPTPHWDYATFHTNGAGEEQRKIGHNAMEIWDGPTITNETSRFPEVGMWVGADMNRIGNLAYDSAAGAALLCAGSCFHSVHGKNSSLFDRDTIIAAAMWCMGASSIDLSQQDEPYSRVDRCLREYHRGSASVCIRP